MTLTQGISPTYSRPQTVIYSRPATKTNNNNNLRATQRRGGDGGGGAAAAVRTFTSHGPLTAVAGGGRRQLAGTGSGPRPGGRP